MPAGELDGVGLLPLDPQPPLLVAPGALRHLSQGK